MPAYSGSGQFARLWWNYNQQSNSVVDSHSVSSVSDIQAGFLESILVIHLEHDHVLLPHAVTIVVLPMVVTLSILKYIQIPQTVM